MAFYDLTKKERIQLVDKITLSIRNDISANTNSNIRKYFSDEDTYVRKTGYLAVGKLYITVEDLQPVILAELKQLSTSKLDKVRQTVINAAGEIGKIDFEIVVDFFDTGLFDKHHSVRNAVIGSLKKMGEKNPEPTLKWAKGYLHHEDKEIRREICHGIELRGRTHPQDILPLLKDLQNDSTARVRNTLIHVLGQIAYKKGCLKTVVKALNEWDNRELVDTALEEIIDVHHRYRDFAILTQKQAIDYIDKNYLDHG